MIQEYENIKRTISGEELLAAATEFHESQFNNGNYGWPWEKVSKESKVRYLEGMKSALAALGIKIEESK